GLDNIDKLEPIDRAMLETDLGLALRKPSYLVTYHPVTLRGEDPAIGMRDLLRAIDDGHATIVLTGVNADTGGRSMRQVAERFAHERAGRVLLAETLGARRYLSLMQIVDVVIGNSSSGLIEAPAIGTPTIDIGQRQQGRLRAPSVIHCADEPQAIRSALDRALSAEHKALAARKETPYGTAGAAERIAGVLRSHSLQGLLIKRFCDLAETSR
ncbi:MAG TPA: UDP-N-acetylglucosamine 2-epimerase, partial [Burkholderiaceae bacterium]|nr:UDP-N-acetylglucosamine 2-epimerase [Burkholderiaceae bacterium]